VTTPDQLRDIVQYLQSRVRLHPDRDREIVFDPIDLRTEAVEGLDLATVERLAAVPWWSEMVADILETPEFAEPEATAEVILGYARDVVQEYVWKRFPLEA